MTKSEQTDDDEAIIVGVSMTISAVLAIIASLLSSYGFFEAWLTIGIVLVVVFWFIFHADDLTEASNVDSSSDDNLEPDPDYDEKPNDFIGDPGLRVQQPIEESEYDDMRVEVSFIDSIEALENEPQYDEKMESIYYDNVKELYVDPEEGTEILFNNGETEEIRLSLITKIEGDGISVLVGDGDENITKYTDITAVRQIINRAQIEVCTNTKRDSREDYIGWLRGAIIESSSSNTNAKNDLSMSIQPDEVIESWSPSDHSEDVFEEWCFNAESAIYYLSDIDENIIYASTSDGLFAVNILNGDEKWFYNTKKSVGQVTFEKDTVCFESGDYLKVLSANDGDLSWEFRINDTENEKTKIIDSPLIKNNSIYIGVADNQFQSLDGQDGRGKWSIRIKEVPDGFTAYSKPAVDDGNVYVYCYDDCVRGINAQTGSEKWKFDVSNYYLRQPSISESQVFVGDGDGKLYAIDKNSGSQNWCASGLQSVRSVSSVKDNMIFAGDTNGDVVAFNTTNGNKIWRFKTGGSVEKLSISKETLISKTGRSDGQCYAINIGSGTELWRYQPNKDARVLSMVTNDGIAYIGDEDGYLTTVNINKSQ